MKTKFLLAMALPLALAACSNEFDEVSNNSQVAMGEKIASKGVLTVDRNLDAETRLTASGWENGDKVGLAWINNTATAITTAQGSALGTSTDQVVYANHLFTHDNGVFTTEGDIYNGAYFAYYPFSRQSGANGATEKIITLNGTQTEVSDSKAYFKGAFSISTRDMITPNDVNADGEVEKLFALQPIANALAIYTELKNNQEYTTAQIDGMEITKITLDLNGKNSFVNQFTLKPQNLGVAQYNDGTFNVGNSLLAVVGSNKKIVSSTAFDYTAVDELSLNVDNGATLASTNKGFVLFTLPTTDTDATVNDVTLTIRTVAGTITIKYDAEATDGTPAAVNNAAIEKLVALLDDTYGWRNDAGTVYKLGRVEDRRIGLSFQIDMKNFLSIESDIKSAKEWNAAVKYFDTFRADYKPTFVITNNIEFTTEEPLTLPKKGLVVDNANAETITFKSGSHTVNQLLTTDVPMVIANRAALTVEKGQKPLLTLNNQVTLTVNAGGTLNVEGEITVPATKTASIENSGVVNVGQNGVISDKAATPTKIVVNNKTATAMIVISYDSYVHHNEQGIIKGVVDGNDELAANYYTYLIKRMTEANSGKSGSAAYPVACNTIELKNITVKEGDESETLANGLTWASTDHAIKSTSFDGVDLILGNANLTSAYTTAAKMTYKSLTVYGETTMKGLFGDGNVTVKEDAELSVLPYNKSNGAAALSALTTGALTIEKNATVNLEKVTVTEPAISVAQGAALNMTSNAWWQLCTIKATDITNKGTISVGVNSNITYSGALDNKVGSSTSGALASVNAVAALAAAVVAAEDAMQAETTGLEDTYAAVAGHVNTYGASSNTKPEPVEFAEAFNAWWEAQTGTTIAYDKITAEMLEGFETISGLNFGLTD